MNIIENFKIALDSIKSNKMRSFLTMLGIIIGISSVITIVALGQGGKNNIIGEFEKMGASNLTIAVDSGNAQNTDYITLKDIETIKNKLGTVKYISPTVQKKGIASSETTTKEATIIGSNQDFTQINNYNMIQGRFFNENEVAEGKMVAVIDEKTAIKLFGYSDVVGKSIKVGSETSSQKVRIVGIREAVNMGPNVDKAFVNIPISFMQRLYSETRKISSVTITSTNKDELDSTAKSSVNILESRHHNRGKDIYTSENMLDKLSQINNVLSIFTSFIAAVAAISLLVGGIGVMNIMLVSVTERTREIGIRKAIGATTRAILIQFLTESSIISLIGGIIGMIFGYIAAQLIGMAVNVTPSISIFVVIAVIIFSSAIGIFFGIYPAKKAAQLNPIDALRYE